MLKMPAPDRAVLARRAEIVAALRAIVPGEGVIDADVERRAYESDGLTAYRTLPMVVVLPENTGQVVQVLKYCSGAGVKVVPRGAGTSLSGGALPLADGVLLGLGKFNRILDIDIANRCAVVQPGVIRSCTSHDLSSVRMALAGAPTISELSGKTLPSVLSALAPMRQFAPIRAPLRMVLPIPTSVFVVA